MLRAIGILVFVLSGTDGAAAQETIDVMGHLIPLRCEQWKRNADGSWATVGTIKTESVSMDGVTLKGTPETQVLDAKCPH